MKLLHLIEETLNLYKDDYNYPQIRNYVLNTFSLINNVSENEDTYTIESFKPKFYIHIENRFNMVDSGDNLIEKLFIKDEKINNELTSKGYSKEFGDFLKVDNYNNYQEYKLNEIIEIYLEKHLAACRQGQFIFKSLIVTNDEHLLQTFMYSISIDDLVDLCRFECVNKDILKLNLKSFKVYDRHDLMSNFIKVLAGKIVSANTKFTEGYLVDDGKAYYGGIGMDGWQFNKKFNFLKTPNLYSFSDTYNEILTLRDYPKETILFFSKILKYDTIAIFKNRELWQETKLGLKYYDKTNNIRIYVDEHKFELLIKNLEFLYINIETVVDTNLYIEYHIKPWTTHDIHTSFHKRITEHEYRCLIDSEYDNEEPIEAEI